MNDTEIIHAYESGKSMNAIANEFGTYATTIRRILIKHKIELRHDKSQKGSYTIKDGDKLIAWAKEQDRLVTKKELAKYLGKATLSPSYFEKYPELGKYVSNYNNRDLDAYIEELGNWLIKHHISFKPGDRTRLKTSVHFLLMGKYSNIALQVLIKPKNVSKKVFEQSMTLKNNRASKAGITLIFLLKEDFETLDDLQNALNRVIARRE